jgi:hypothetical protein
MRAKIIKLLVSAHIIYEDGDEILGETITKPINVYRGVEIENSFITEIERLALQEFKSGRSSSD